MSAPQWSVLNLHFEYLDSTVMVDIQLCTNLTVTNTYECGIPMHVTEGLSLNNPKDGALAVMVHLPLSK